MRDKVTCFGVPCLPTTTFENVFSGTNRALILARNGGPIHNTCGIKSFSVLPAFNFRTPNPTASSQAVFSNSICALSISLRGSRSGTHHGRTGVVTSGRCVVGA